MTITDNRIWFEYEIDGQKKCLIYDFFNCMVKDLLLFKNNEPFKAHHQMTTSSRNILMIRQGTLSQTSASSYAEPDKHWLSSVDMNDLIDEKFNDGIVGFEFAFGSGKEEDLEIIIMPLNALNENKGAITEELARQWRYNLGIEQ